MLERDLYRKAELVGNLIRTVQEYFRAFASPVPLKVLSAKYGKALNKVGGFSPTIEELFSDGTLEIVLLRTGGKAVYPGGSIDTLNTVDAVTLKRG